MKRPKITKTMLKNPMEFQEELFAASLSDEQYERFINGDSMAVWNEVTKEKNDGK